MAKMAIIRRCNVCPHHAIKCYPAQSWCRHRAFLKPGRLIMSATPMQADPHFIPAWCPLEDAPEREEAA